MYKVFCILALFIFQLNTDAAFSKIGNDTKADKKQYGKELSSKEFTDKKLFSGKKSYPSPLFGWQVEALYKNDVSYSETARPKGFFVKKKIIDNKEANSLAHILYPLYERGPYRKQVKNANFISHFYEHGVVSFEMELDKRRKNHIGVIGVRTVKYNNGEIFKDIKVNAYQ